ncbi:hypothetical protein LV716_05730 [Flagellimonas sp. HMM57]|uniref:hypothetical protein n=1 Tax=unclassified Flagellimonas TaxID=2644544 RepID=UPI0013D1F75D|nr:MULTISPECIES: hypothetical protein [unclassified Flagellimonas]UII77271.1 hypothetical protein LV716_05730 [Flagellimonas sp. HMM57]
MDIPKLQNEIIKDLLAIEDEKTLLLFKQLLSNHAGTPTYQLSTTETDLIAESIANYKANKVLANESVFKKNDRWLNE